MADQVRNALGRIARAVLRASLGEAARRPRRCPGPVPAPRAGRTGAHGTAAQRGPRPTKDYPGDYDRRPQLSYDPHPDRMADPGEVVWTWVPFEEDYSQGKDRPVLIVGRDGDWLLGLMLTSQDHDDRADREHREGRWWCNIGSGDWDSRHRDSEVRTDRILRVDPDNVRRLAGRLAKDRFDVVAAEVDRHWND